MADTINNWTTEGDGWGEGFNPDKFIQLQNFKKVFKNGTRKNRFMLDFKYVTFGWATELFQAENGSAAGELKFLVESASLPGKSVKSIEREFQGMKTYYAGDYDPPSGFSVTFLSDIGGKAYSFCESWLNAKKNNLTNTYGSKDSIEFPLVAWQTDDQGDVVGAWMMFGCVINDLSSIDKSQGTGDFETFQATFDCEFREVMWGSGDALLAAVPTFLNLYTASSIV